MRWRTVLSMDQTANDPFSIPAKRSLGQHFLNSTIVPNWLCDTAQLQKDVPVLEIGPGTGVLTEELLRQGVSVLALETDPRSITALEDRFKEQTRTGQLHIYEGDIRNGIPDHPWLVDHQYQVVANIPYYLTGFILRTYLESDRQPQRMTLLVQKEVAVRIARSQKASLLQVAVQVFGQPRYVRTVSRGHFSPAPRVDSAILDIADITHHNVPSESRGYFFTVLRAGFAHKRKRLASNLQTAFPKKDVPVTFREMNLDPNVRAEALDWRIWIALSKSLEN